MKTKTRIVGTIGLVIVGSMTLAVLSGQIEQSQRSIPPSLEKNYQVLDNPRWHENDPFLVREPIDGKLPSGLMRWGDAAIRGREISCIMDVLNEYARNPTVAEKLKGYVAHHNKAVAVLSVAGLVRHGDWTRESAIEYAEKSSWTAAEVRGMVRLSRTPLDEAYDVLDNPRWHENDVSLSLLQPVDGKLEETPRNWTPTAVEQRELSSILVVCAEYVSNPSVAEKLKKYAEHHNRTVAAHAAGGLVRGGAWTKEFAVQFARERTWTLEEIQSMLQLGEGASGD